MGSNLQLYELIIIGLALSWIFYFVWTKIWKKKWPWKNPSAVSQKNYFTNQKIKTRRKFAVVIAIPVIISTAFLLLLSKVGVEINYLEIFAIWGIALSFYAYLILKS